MENNNILTATEAAKYLKVTKKTLLKLIKEGKIRALRVGKVYRIIKEELKQDLREINR